MFCAMAYHERRKQAVTVKRILLTGISGVGKSTLTDELVARGYNAIDADTAEWCEWVEVTDNPEAYGPSVEPDRDWVWREDRIQALLDSEDTAVLFLSGCAQNMRRFLPQFDHVVLLSTPAHLIAERLSSRTNNPYGKHPDDAARVLGLKQTIEPLLRGIAGHEIDTSAPLDEVVAMLLRLTV
jgi:shikimate kinase